MDEGVAAARRSFAEELRYTARVGSAAVVAAFATVPRERFAGPGPWQLLSPMRMGSYWSTGDADPRHLYHDVLIALDPARRLNNGQPSLWAARYDQLELPPGGHVVHVGAGTGYYSAILAEIVGSTGHVTALEVDAPLAARAEANLAPWPQVAVLADNGFTYQPEAPVDAIIVNAGVVTLSPLWLDALKPTGRLLVPLTDTRGSGGFLRVARSPATPQHDAARFVSRTRIFPCADGRPAEAETRLEAALRGKGLAAVRSLHRGPCRPMRAAGLPARAGGCQPSRCRTLPWRLGVDLRQMVVAPAIHPPPRYAAYAARDRVPRRGVAD